jgi:hypothetical protein
MLKGSRKFFLTLHVAFPFIPPRLVQRPGLDSLKHQKRWSVNVTVIDRIMESLLTTSQASKSTDVSERTVPMEILNLSMPRTGSLCQSSTPVTLHSLYSLPQVRSEIYKMVYFTDFRSAYSNQTCSEYIGHRLLPRYQPRRQ